MDERRRAERYRVWFPMRTQTDAEGENLAMSQNISTSGLLMATTRELAEGAAVTVIFRVPPDNGDEQRVVGKVVRFEENENDPEGLWPYRVAVEFEDVHPELEPILASLKDRQSQIPPAG